jgi:DNA-binding NtrC family response regulator
MACDVKTSEPPVVAAIFNTSPDIVDVMRRAFEPAGVVTVTAFTHQIRDGIIDADAFLKQHDPKVVVYDIAPPYEENWRLFKHISSMPAMEGRQVVLTSVNAKHVEELAGNHEKVYEVVGKPLDIDRIVRAVKEAARARPTR